MFAPLLVALVAQAPGTLDAGVALHLEADRDGVELYRFVDAEKVKRGDLEVARKFKELLCKLPCDVTLDPGQGGRLFFGGLTVPPSRRLKLEDLSGPTDVRVEAGSLNRFVGGYMTMASGFVLLILGAVAAGTGALEDWNVGAAKEIKAGLFGVGGGAFLVGGVVFISGRTTFDVQPRRADPVK